MLRDILVGSLAGNGRKLLAKLISSSYRSNCGEINDKLKILMLA